MFCAYFKYDVVLKKTGELFKDILFTWFTKNYLHTSNYTFILMLPVEFI